MRTKILVVALLLCLLAVGSSLAGTLRVTPDQTFRVNGSWVPAEALSVGDKLVTADGRVAVVTSIETVTTTENFTAYGLCTQHPGNFFAADLLVGGVCREPPSEKDSAEPAGQTATVPRWLAKWHGLIGRLLSALWEDPASGP